MSKFQTMIILNCVYDQVNQSFAWLIYKFNTFGSIKYIITNIMINVSTYYLTYDLSVLIHDQSQSNICSGMRCKKCT